MTEPHFDCLQTVSFLLNKAQDIEDILRDFEEGQEFNLVDRIRETNNQVIEKAAAYLPG